MIKYFDSVLRRTGGPYPGVVVTVRLFPSEALAPIYTNDGSGLITNSQVITDANGFFEFFCDVGRYILDYAYANVTMREVVNVDIGGIQVLEDLASSDPGEGASLIDFSQYGVTFLTSKSMGIDRANPANAYLYIGSGTGSLTDDPKMGVKVKIDTTASTSPSGIQSNVNIIQGTPTGNVIGNIARVDINDVSVNTGDVVALWGDVFVNTNSARNTFGMNAYVSIDPSSSYTGVAVGAEIALTNNNTSHINTGGVLQTFSTGTGAVRYNHKIAGGNGGTKNYHVGTLVPSDSRGPIDWVYWYGTVAAGNIPSGDPLFAVDADGDLYAGVTANFGGTLGNGVDTILVKRSVENFPRLKIDTGGQIAIGDGTLDVDTLISRNTTAQIAIGQGLNNSLTIGTTTGDGNQFLQLYEQSVATVNGPANTARLYAVDNGAGKTQLYVRFATGAAQLLATEP